LIKVDSAASADSNLVSCKHLSWGNLEAEVGVAEAEGEVQQARMSKTALKRRRISANQVSGN